MHLYGSPASPFVQRALMTARAKGHEIECRPPPGGDMRSAEFRELSPMGRIPVLALDDGQHLCESAAIAAYLDETLAGPALFPADPLARARVREIEALAVGEIGVGLRPIMFNGLYGKRLDSEPVIAARAQIAQGLDALDRLIGDRLSHGDAITAADCALMPLLTLLSIADPLAATWPAVAGRARVLAYHDRALNDPLIARSMAEMRAAFAPILASLDR